uniref:CD99 molecule n=1 Tax=Neolamprologus brichardi TaxID=32507 RepID=A0A3Q4MRG9_NEOBR
MYINYNKYGLCASIPSTLTDVQANSLCIAAVTAVCERLKSCDGAFGGLIMGCKILSSNVVLFPFEGSGPIAGIISAVGVALVGAASSYFAYQKKKLCFKLQGGADPESGKGHQGTRSEPQVLSNLLQTN